MVGEVLVIEVTVGALLSTVNCSFVVARIAARSGPNGFPATSVKVALDNATKKV